MRNLNEYGVKCMKMLDSIGIEYGTIETWKINTRAKQRWGQCKRLLSGNYEININADFLDERNSEKGLENTITHELLHSCEGCMNHGTEWKKLANEVYEKLGYKIQTTSTQAEKGIEYRTEPKPRKESDNLYILQCEDCGALICRTRLCKAIKHPEWYRCGGCHGRLKRIK